MDLHRVFVRYCYNTVTQQMSLRLCRTAHILERSYEKTWRGGGRQTCSFFMLDDNNDDDDEDDANNNNNNNNNYYYYYLSFITVPSQRPSGQWQKEHNMHVTSHNKENTKETNINKTKYLRNDSRHFTMLNWKLCPGVVLGLLKIPKSPHTESGSVN
jgi:hypothetical protein